MKTRHKSFRILGWLRPLAAAGFALAVVGQPTPALQSVHAADQPTAVAAKAADFEETWQAVYFGNSRVGHGRSTTARKQRDGRLVIATDVEMSLAITRFGQSVKTKTRMQTEETVDGDLLRFDFELLNPPAAATRKTGRIENDRLLLESEVDGKTTRSEAAWDKALKAPGYQDRTLRENPLQTGEKRTLRSFDPQFGKATVVTLEARGEEEVALLDGSKRRLRKVSVASSATPGIVLDEFLDAQGDALVTRMSLLGMAIHKVSKEEALKSLTGEETDLAVATLVKTTKIDRAPQTRRVVYRITIPGDDPAKILAAGPTQQWSAVGPNSVDLTVSAVAPPARPAAARPPEPEFLESNDYIQSDDARVRDLANRAAGAEPDPWTVSRKLESWVHQNLTRKNFSTLLASAAEVARDLQGDCTEHAVLLAAMARARKIPSRVVVGLVYVDSLSSFGGHMWTEVMIGGEWIPLDATLGQGGIAAEHIKFADSSFSEKNAVAPLATFLPLVSVLGKLQIEVRSVEYR